MRHDTTIRLISVLATTAAAALAVGCGSKATSTTAWSCENVLVPNGSTVECTGDTASGLTADATPYSCPLNGDINPLCPPTGSTPPPDAGGGYTTGADDAGAGTTPPVGTGGGGSTGTVDAGSGAGGGGDWGCDAGPPVGTGGGTTTGDGKPGNGNPNPGGGNPHGGPPGQGSGGSTGGAADGGYGGGATDTDAGSTGGGYTGGDTDGGDGSGWTCDTSSGKPVCHTPPKCDAGTHPSACGACVPDGSNEDCTPPSSGGCWITGGGFIVDGDGHDSFGGNAMPMKSGAIRGEWEHVDHGTGNKLHGEPSYIVCRHVDEPGPGANTGPKHDFTMNQAYFGGIARAFVNGAWHDGYWFDVMVEDHGEGKGAKAGGPDYYHVTLRLMTGANASGVVVYDTEANMSGGNVQLHPPNNGHPFTSSALPAWVSLQP